MCCEIALDSDLPFPRSAFLTFPFEAYLDSPDRTQHDQRRLVPSALFPDKSDGLGKWSMLRIIKYFCACWKKINEAQLLSGYRWFQHCKCDPKSLFLQLEQLVHIACKRRKRLQLVSEKNKWPLFAAKGADNGLIGYCTRWQGSWLRELQRTYPFTMARYRGSALQLLRVKSSVFHFFSFFFNENYQFLNIYSNPIRT